MSLPGSAIPRASDAVGWGFLPCTAAIATKNFKAVQASPRSVLVAVASRDPARARAWLAARGAPPEVTAHDYGGLLADPRVEAVYMPLPTSAHVEWVVAAARARKLAVIVEKPCALRGADLRAMAAACAAAGTLLCDGVMFQHHPRTRAMIAALPRLGAPRRMTAAFSFAGDAAFFAGNIRVRADADALGCVGDLGWYTIRMALLVYGARPTRVRARAHARAPSGVPIDASFTLDFDGGAVADCHCAFNTIMRQWVEVAGDAGVLRCDDFVLPRTSGPRSAARFSLALGTRLEDDHCRVVDEEAQDHVFHDVCQEAAMFDAVAAAAREAQRGPLPADHPAHQWLRLAIDTQAVVDAVMESLDDGGRDKEVARE